ncbi:MAG: hypothetical protein ACYDD6_02450 [Acidimicrobiales bacterium]
MVVVLFAVQACLWAHAAALVQSAAAEGTQSACDLGGSVPAGVDRAREFLAAAASSVVVGPQVEARSPSGSWVEMRVTGTVESVLPWFHLSVSAIRRGTVEKFRSSG